MPQISDQATIAENIRVGKARRRATDADIARAIGTSRSAVNDRMNGRAKFQIVELQKISAFLDIPLEQLLEPPVELSSCSR